MREMFSFSYLLIVTEAPVSQVLQWNCLDFFFLMRSPKKNKRLWNLESNILLEIESRKKKKLNRRSSKWPTQAEYKQKWLLSISASDTGLLQVDSVTFIICHQLAWWPLVLGKPCAPTPKSSCCSWAAGSNIYALPCATFSYLAKFFHPRTPSCWIDRNHLLYPPKGCTWPSIHKRTSYIGEQRIIKTNP